MLFLYGTRPNYRMDHRCTRTCGIRPTASPQESLDRILVWFERRRVKELSMSCRISGREVVGTVRCVAACTRESELEHSGM